MDINVSDIFMAALSQFLAVALPILVTIIGAYLVQQLRLLEAKLKNEKPDVYAEVVKYATWAVMAAEQLGLTKILEQGYEDKKAFAIAFVVRELELRGIKNIDMQYIADKIEAAVWEEINKWKDTPQLPEIR